MSTWFVSDTHFLHRNLMQHYPDRARFADEYEMTEWMIQEWNRMIRPGDTVYHMGDFGAKDQAACVKIAARLHGKKHLVAGNHDYKLVKNPDFCRHFTEVYPNSYREISINKQLIVLCHYPIWEWNKIHRGSWHIHGHVHGKPTGVPGKILDAGVDGNGLRAYTLDQVAAFMDNRPIRHHHTTEE